MAFWTKQEKIEGMTVIGNITAMRDLIGLSVYTPDYLMSRYSLEEIREMQEDLIPRYNKAIKDREEKS